MNGDNHETASAAPAAGSEGAAEVTNTPGGQEAEPQPAASAKDIRRLLSGFRDATVSEAPGDPLGLTVYILFGYRAEETLNTLRGHTAVAQADFAPRTTSIIKVRLRHAGDPESPTDEGQQ